jgi:tRNA/tmRNA/rRNA uracil-C5-methylase (TrmA/RlmC/RlmD family)
MISRRQLPELRAYAQAEAVLPFRVQPEYAQLVVPNGNETRPVHRWFKYKEAFSANLLDHLLGSVELGLAPASSVRLLDPFCGVGTSLVSAQLLKSGVYSVEAIGVECNPFSAFVARTKASWPLVDPARLRALAARGESSCDGFFSD